MNINHKSRLERKSQDMDIYTYDNLSISSPLLCSSFNPAPSHLTPLPLPLSPYTTPLLIPSLHHRPPPPPPPSSSHTPAIFLHHYPLRISCLTSAESTRACMCSNVGGYSHSISFISYPAQIVASAEDVAMLQV